MRTVRFRDSREQVTVGKIVCVGENYAKHIAELKGRIPEKPMLFFKPTTSLLAPQQPIQLPHFSSEIHHEVELVILIGQPARFLKETDALGCVSGYAVGMDLTARDIQREARKAGDPWAVAKGFDGSAPISDFAPAEEVGEAGDLAIELRVNGEVRQSARTSDMIFGIPKLLSYASSVFTLEPGDLLFTGTPSGVGIVQAGDLLEVSIEKVGSARWKVEA